MSLLQYIRETRSELKKVNWPTRATTIRSTILVILFSLVVSIYLGALDALFQLILKRFVL